MSTNDEKVLNVLSRSAWSDVDFVAGKTGLDKATCSAVLERLYDAGTIHRVPPEPEFNLGTVYGF